jgi:heptosyltransferase-2
MDRFLFIRFGSIGNTLVSIPAVRALRKAYPSAFIAMVVSPGIDDLLSDIPWINELIVYDMRGAHKSLFAYLRFIHELRKRRFDTAILLKRFLRSELIGLLSGAKRRIGFETDGKSNFLTDSVPYAEGTNIVELNMMLLKPLGIHSTDPSLELDLRNCADYKIMHLVHELESKGRPRYAVLHPGGKTVQGAGLSVSSCAKIISRLAGQFNLTCFVIGDNSDSAAIEAIVKQSDTANPPFTAVGLPLKELGCLIQHASLFIGNDSGPCHIADAVGTPGIILYPPLYNLGDHLKKWKPAGDNYIAITPKKSCETCDEYPCEDRVKIRCIEDIDIEPIFNYTEQILTKRNV